MGDSGAYGPAPAQSVHVTSLLHRGHNHTATWRGDRHGLCLKPGEQLCSRAAMSHLGDRHHEPLWEVTRTSLVPHTGLLSSPSPTAPFWKRKGDFSMLGVKGKKQKLQAEPPQEPVCGYTQERGCAQGHGFAPRVFYSAPKTLPTVPGGCPTTGLVAEVQRQPRFNPAPPGAFPRCYWFQLHIPTPGIRGTRVLCDPAGTVQPGHRSDGLGAGQHHGRGKLRPRRSHLSGTPRAPQDSTSSTHLPQAGHP